MNPLTAISAGEIQPGMFRLILAWLVVLHHCLRIFPVGAMAVYTFFILSGYWVGRMYEEFYSKQKSPYRLFIFSRIWRLYPLYWLCTIVMLFLANFFSVDQLPPLGFKEYFYLATLVPLNLLDFKLLNPAWSLAVEMQFYLLVPIFIQIVRRVNHVFLLAITAFLTLLFTFGFDNSYKMNETVLGYLVYFFIGMLIYFRKSTISETWVNLSLITIAAVIIVSFAVPPLRQALLYERDGTTYGYYNFFNHVMPILFIPFIIYNLSQKSSSLDRQLGDISYTIYLVHWIPLSIYVKLFPYGGFTIEKAIGLVANLTLTLILSLLVYRHFECLVSNSRKKFIALRSASAA